MGTLSLSLSHSLSLSLSLTLSLSSRTLAAFVLQSTGPTLPWIILFVGRGIPQHNLELLDA